MRNIFRALTAILTLLGILTPVIVAAQNYPGASIFSYQCAGSGIIFSWNGAPVIEVSLAQIAQPLSVASRIHQNLPIRGGSAVSLWALQSNELQIHENKDPDGTKLVLSATICGSLPVDTNSPAAFSGQALSYVQLNGPGQALAYAQVSPSGQIQAYAQISGSGQAFAYAQSTTSGTPNAGSGHYHIVQAGENLFRIALRYGTTVSVLVSINNLSDASLIYVGQKIYLP